MIQNIKHSINQSIYMIQNIKHSQFYIEFMQYIKEFRSQKEDRKKIGETKGLQTLAWKQHCSTLS